MKLAELIAKLMTQHEKHGNIEVFTRGETIGWTEEICTEVDSDDDHTFLLLGTKEDK